MFSARSLSLSVSSHMRLFEYMLIFILSFPVFLRSEIEFRAESRLVHFSFPNLTNHSLVPLTDIAFLMSNHFKKERTGLDVAQDSGDALYEEFKRPVISSPGGVV
jgi:hypothetical protein